MNFEDSDLKQIRESENDGWEFLLRGLAYPLYVKAILALHNEQQGEEANNFFTKEEINKKIKSFLNSTGENEKLNEAVIQAFQKTSFFYPIKDYFGGGADPYIDCKKRNSFRLVVKHKDTLERYVRLSEELMNYSVAAIKGSK